MSDTEPKRQLKIGGATPGAGRKKRQPGDDTVKALSRIKKLTPELVEALYGLAVGVWYLDDNLKGAERIYKTLPNYKALEYLLNHGIGKPSDRTEITGANGGAIQINENLTAEQVKEKLLSLMTSGKMRQAAFIGSNSGGVTPVPDPTPASPENPLPQSNPSTSAPNDSKIVKNSVEPGSDDSVGLIILDGTNG